MYKQTNEVFRARVFEFDYLGN